MTLALYLLAINLLTFVLYWHDKASARRGARRVPEYVLLLAGLAGGTLAAVVAMVRLRHKTRKGSYLFKFWALTLVQVGLVLFPPAALKLLFSRFFG